MNKPNNREEFIVLLQKHKTYSAIAKELNCGETSVRRWATKFGVTKHPPIMQELKNQLLNIPKLEVVKTASVKGETLVILLSDWHIGPVVKNENGNIVYSMNIAKTRAKIICEKIIYLTQHHISAGTKITDIVILLAGDIADGELVYDTQMYNTPTSTPKQVMAAIEILIGFIEGLRTTKLPIRIYGVKGNHGIPKIKGLNPESNMDLMIYMILDFWVRSMKYKNISVDYAEGDFLNVSIRNHRFHLRHRGPSQTETPSGGIKAAGWKQIHDCDAIVYGHLHHFNIGEWMGIRTFMGGSLKGMDDFAESIAKCSEPSQLVWGVTNSHLSSFIYVADLK